jgi:hypothetical protein
MYSEEFQNLLNQRTAAISGSAEKKNLGKKLRNLAQNFDEVLFVVKEFKMEPFERRAIELIKNIDQWRSFFYDIRLKNKYLDELFKIIFLLKVDDDVILDEIRKLSLFNHIIKILYYTNLEGRNTLSQKIIKEVYDKKIITGLINLHNYFVHNDSYEQAILSGLDGGEFATYVEVYRNSSFGSNLETNVLIKLLNTFSVNILLYYLSNINSYISNRVSHVDCSYMSRWLVKDLKLFDLDDDELTNGIDENLDISNFNQFDNIIKLYKFRRELIKFLSKNLSTLDKIFILISCLDLEEDIEIFINNNSNPHLHILAEIDRKDRITNWYPDAKDLTLDSNEVYESFPRFRKLVNCYFDTNYYLYKSRYFWTIKFLLLSKKISPRERFDFYDARLGSDSRFMNYFINLLNHGIISQDRMAALFTWPFVNALVDGKPFVADQALFNVESPLHALGYIVGASINLPNFYRRELLKKAFMVDSNDFFNYGWGTAGSPLRLSSLARHISRNIFRFRNRESYNIAIEDWTVDLDYLKSSFYDNRMASEFVWPKISNKITY